ncbi:hypothetical protein NEOKW01_1230 [Nematocida sp. AWRm80]|nr:hypothetical protein NEOKW01_1230 [Nematocida sp. AWRm80]
MRKQAPKQEETVYPQTTLDTTLSPAFLSASFCEEEDRSFIIAQTIASIKDIEIEEEKREKNRLAARRSREKKNRRYKETQIEIENISHTNKALLSRINQLSQAIGSLLQEIHSSFSVELFPVTRLVSHISAIEHLLSLSPAHTQILLNLKLLLLSAHPVLSPHPDSSSP